MTNNTVTNHIYPNIESIIRQDSIVKPEQYMMFPYSTEIINATHIVKAHCDAIMDCETVMYQLYDTIKLFSLIGYMMDSVSEVNGKQIKKISVTPIYPSAIRHGERGNYIEIQDCITHYRITDTSNETYANFFFIDMTTCTSSTYISNLYYVICQNSGSNNYEFNKILSFVKDLYSEYSKGKIAYIKDNKDNYPLKVGERFAKFTGLNDESFMEFDQVIGDVQALPFYRNVTDRIANDIQLFFNQKEFFTKYNIKYRRGALLFGKPGNGKSTFLKNAIKLVQGIAKVVIWQVTEFTASFSLDNIEGIIRESAEPVMLIIEDIDSLPVSVRSAFLNFLDGITTLNGVYVIATTNYPDKIDPGLMNRAGRFDLSFEFTNPDDDMRKDFLIQRGVDSFDLDQEKLMDIVKNTKGFSLAQLNEVFVELAISFHMTGKADASIVETIRKAIKTQNKNTYYEKDNGNTPVGFGS